MVARFKFRDRQHGGQFFAGFKIQQIDNRLTQTHTAGLGNVINLAPVHLTFVREKHECVMGRGHKQVLDKIIVFGTHGRFAFASATLIAVKRYRIAFNISPLGNGNHHILFDNHIFNADFFGLLNNFRVPLIAEICLYLIKFIFDNIENQPFAG